MIYFGSILASFSLHFASCRRPFSNILGSKMHAVISITFQCDLLSSFCPSWPPLGLPLALPRPPTWLQNGFHIAFESQFHGHSLQEHPGPSPRSPKSLPKHSPNLDFGYDFNSVLMACWQCLDYFSAACLQHSNDLPTTFLLHSSLFVWPFHVTCSFRPAS